VHEDELVIESKGIYSVEKFLVARRLMYWQVYLHKNVVCSGEMLKQIINRAKKLFRDGVDLPVSESLRYFLKQELNTEDLKKNTDEIISHFYKLDDADIMMAIKNFSYCSDFVLSHLSKNLLERKLLKIELRNNSFEANFFADIFLKTKKKYDFLSDEELSYLVFEGKERNHAYRIGKEEIQIKMKDGTIKPISQWEEHNVQQKEVIKYFVCYPALI
jgi:HD superfamily phosphohydrolase